MSATTLPSIGSKLALIAVLAFSLFVVVNGLAHPIYNWDMIAYVASAKSLEIKDPEILHRQVYAELKEFMPAEHADIYRELIGGPYRGIMSRDAAAFQQQLPYYRVKVLYVFLIFLLSKVGVNIFFATYFLSAFFIGLGLVGLYFTFRHHLHPIIFIFFPAMAWLLNVMEVARMSTPDGLAFCIFILSIYCLLQQTWPIFVVLPLAILIRIDLIVLAGLTLAYLYFFVPRWRWQAGLIFIVSWGLCLGVGRYYGIYKFATTYHMALVNLLPYPAQAQVEFGLADYIRDMGRVWQRLFSAKEMEFLLYLTFAIPSLIIFFWKKINTADPVTRQMGFLCLLMFLYIAVHLILYPFPSNSLRYFIAPYLIGLLGFLRLMAPQKIARALPARTA